MTGEPLDDPQARCLMATGAEAEVLEAEWQAHLKTIWSADFHAWCDELVAKGIAERDRAWAEEEKAASEAAEAKGWAGV